MYVCVYVYIYTQRNPETHFLFLQTHVFASADACFPRFPPNLALQNTKIEEAQRIQADAHKLERFPLSFSFKEPFHAT